MIGVVFAVGLLIIPFFINNAVDYIMVKNYYQGESYDLIVRFSSMTSERELTNISRLDGVERMEGFMELPVKIHFRDKAEDDVLLAYPVDLSMKTLQDASGKTIKVPDDGIIINQRTAQKLGVKVGDQVEVETTLPMGPSHLDQLEIIGETEQLFGGGSYVSLERANRILQESRLVSGVMLKIAPGKADGVASQLNQMLGIASVVSSGKEIQTFQQEVGGVLTTEVSILIFFAVMLGFAIVYNASVITFAERRREFASLRVLGFTMREISGLLLQENIILLIGGIIMGLPFGRWMVQSYVQSASTDQFTLPVVIYPTTYLYAAIGGIIFVGVAHLFAVRGVKDLDMVSTLKNTD
jgi:putative ABC transport system permease protein